MRDFSVYGYQEQLIEYKIFRDPVETSYIDDVLTLLFTEWDVLDSNQ